VATAQELLGQIQRTLGQLEANVEGLRRDVAEIKVEAAEVAGHSTESRARLHERVDGLVMSIQKVELDAKLATATAAQARDAIGHLTSELQHHGEKLDAHIKIVVPVVKRVRRLEWRMALFLTAVGAVGAFLWWAVSSNASAIWKAAVKLFGGG
jgi:chromosome segregation ATPase